MTPNIVLLLSDNQRLDTLGVLGKTPCQTPSWDRIAREGVLFENLRTTSPICSPARASIFTGLYPHQAGMPHLPYATPDLRTPEGAGREITRPPMSHYLRQAGYQCLYAGKWHLGDSNITRWFDCAAACDQDDRDYSEWCRSQGIPDGRVFHDPQRSGPFRAAEYPHMSVPRTAVLDIPEDKEWNYWAMEHALALLRDRRPDHPFFLVISLEGPHPPLIVPRAYHDLYDPQTVVEPPNWQPGAAEPSFLDDSYYRRLRRQWGDSFEAWRKPIAVYWGFVTYIDSLFGKFLDRLDESGLAEQTLVAMISDHGEMLGQHGLWQKFCPYEEALRVPWVMRWPGTIEPGNRCTVDASHVDIAPTLLNAAGIDCRQLDMEGENLMPMIAGERAPEPARDCFSQYTLAPDFKQWHGVQNWRAIIRRPWKYVLHQNGESELFNLEDDPFEVNNRAYMDAGRVVAAPLQAALLGWCTRIGDPFASVVRTRPPGGAQAAGPSA